MSKPNVGDLIRIGGEYGTAQAEHVLEGYTIGTEDGIAEGTMPDRGAVVITPSTQNKPIDEGYHNGSGYVKGDANLKAENILSGTSIFGVTGTLLKGVAINSVQRGIQDLKPLTKDITISQVDMNKAVVLITYRAMGDADWQKCNFFFTLAELVSATKLRLERGDGNEYYYPTVYWQVIEFEGLNSVQRGTVSFQDGGSSKNITISQVDMNKAVVLINYRTNDNLTGYIDWFVVGASLSNSTTLNLRRNPKGSSSYYPTVHWQVIEF